MKADTILGVSRAAAVTVVVILGLFAITKLSGLASDAADAELLDRVDSLRTEAAKTDLVIAAAAAREITDSIWRDSATALVAELGDSLRGRERVTRALRGRLDSARATVDEDTLSAGLRALLAIEREVADGFRVERDLGAQILATTRAQLFREEAARVELSRLVVTLVAERDTALAVIATFEQRIEFNLWRWLGAEIPTIVGCAAGGAIASAIAKGDLLVGAGVGAGSCVLVRAVF